MFKPKLKSINVPTEGSTSIFLPNVKTQQQYASSLFLLGTGFIHFQCSRRLNNNVYSFKIHLKSSTFWRRHSWVYWRAAYFRNRSIKVRRDTECSDQTSRDAELPGYSAHPVRLSPVNSSPPAVTKTCVCYYLFLLSTFAPGAKPTIKLMCLSEDLILNCHARSASQITADPVFPLPIRKCWK